MRVLLVCLLVGSTGLILHVPHVAAAQVPLDANGCRKLEPLPPPGVHPRVFFTANEMEQIKRRHSSEFGKAYSKIAKQVIDGVKKDWSEFAERDPATFTAADISGHIKSDAGRNIRWGIASLSSVLADNKELQQMMARVITNHCHLLLMSKRTGKGGDLTLKTGDQLNLKSNIWKTDQFDLGVGWTIGGCGLALSYDVLFNMMTPKQRATVREAIAESTRGRKSYGMGKPEGFACSNHYGYHGDLAVLLAAIEGEEGYDEQTAANIRQVLTDYWNNGFTKRGASHEDGYGPDLGLREGSRGLFVLARRGFNIFETQKYRNFLKYFAAEYEPFPNGRFMGGASGGPYERLYPTSSVYALYMYPDSPAANFIYRHQLGDNFERNFRWQAWLDYAVFGQSWKGEQNREDMIKSVGLELMQAYPRRGKVVVRSDWSDDAIQLTLDARPDAFLIGHDRVDRGNFTLSALGRAWATAGNFREFNTADEHSLVHIDGKAQAWKAPGGKLISWNDDGTRAKIVADTKYAYDWEWTPPWPKTDSSAFQTWEKETVGPFAFNWPKDDAPKWLPNSIYGSETGYSHTNAMRKRKFNPVQKARRTVELVRGATPSVVITDDIRKDDQSHLYEWYMQVPLDLEIISTEPREVVLAAANDKRQLSVRFTSAVNARGQQASKLNFKLDQYTVHEDKNRGTKKQAKRLIVSVQTVEPKFRVVLTPRSE
jgi:hypothetical protein